MQTINDVNQFRAHTQNIILSCLTTFVTRHFSVKKDFTQFRKYRNLCSRQVKPIGVEHLLFFRIRNELQFAKARKVISSEFPPFAKLTKVKLSCRNNIGYGSYMTNVLQ